jgi:2-dehydro-3-deoxygluconokinase
MTESPPLVTFGEVLGVLRAQHPGPLDRGQAMRLSIAGSESNVAIGVRRLGVPATFLGRVGDDQLGAIVRTTLRGEGVQARLHTDPSRPTGLMLTEQRTADVRRVRYYRRDSAGSAITPGDLDEPVIAAAGFVHVTGITAALSPSARDTVVAGVQFARRHNVPVSLDLNFRAALCTPTQFRSYLVPLFEGADLVFASLDEASLVLPDTDTASPEQLAHALRDKGVAEVVLTDGRNGAWAENESGSYRQLAQSVTAVDPIGAGDAFVAGYLASRLSHEPIQDRLRTAARVAAFCVTTLGDWEGLPSRQELALLNLGDGSVTR